MAYVIMMSKEGIILMELASNTKIIFFWVLNGYIGIGAIQNFEQLCGGDDFTFIREGQEWLKSERNHTYYSERVFNKVSNSAIHFDRFQMVQKVWDLKN